MSDVTFAKLLRLMGRHLPVNRRPWEAIALDLNEERPAEKYTFEQFHSAKDQVHKWLDRIMYTNNY
jgi:hypothetical protein